MKDRRVAWAGTLVVVAQQAVVYLHGHAHRSLGVKLTTAQTVFVVVVILAAPILATIPLWTRRARSGAILLAVAMPAALVFGVYNHFLVVSPDHVAHLPAGEQQGLFILTAYLLPGVELAATVVGVWGAAHLRAQVGR